MSLTLLARRTSTSSQVTLGCLSWALPKAPTIQTDLQKSFLSSSSSSSFLQTTRPVPLVSTFSFSLAGSRSYTTNANRPAKEEKKRQIAAARKLLKKQEELLDDDDEDELIILEDAPPRPPPRHEPLVASSALKIEQEEKKNEDDEEDSLFDAVDGSATKRKGKGEEPQFPPKAAKAFIKLGIEKQLTCGVRSFGITTPTPIQEIAIPKILDGASAVLSAQTGTGKTLAYLLPILQLLHRDEKIFLNARELSALEASLGIHEDPNKHLLDESIYKEFLGSQDENAKEIDEEEEEDDEEDDDDDDYEGDEKDSVEENGADEELVLEADEEGEPGSTQTVANARRKKSKLKKKERKRIKRMMSQQKERISEVGDPERDVLRRPKRPRALILVPSRELGLQIYKFTKQIIVSCKWPIRSGCILGGSTKTSIQKKLLSDNNGVDLLIASPDRFLKLRELGAVYYTDMRYLVVDEADTMLVDDFGTKVLEVLRVLKDIKTHSGEHTQLVLASATITPSLLQIVSTSWPEALNLIAPNTNSLLAKATYKFYHATGDKMDELENILNRDTTSRQIIVFCTSVDSCRAVDYHLLAKGFDAVSLHGAIPPKKRTELYEKFQNQQAKILVCTDLASRGLDTINVDHVVMFDFPSNGVDFLHRSGRTARAGRKGLVSCIIRQKDKDFVYLIENALRNGKNIENLDRKMAGSLRKSIEETVRAKRKEAKEKRREDDESGARRSEHKSNLGSRSRARTSTIKKHVPIVYPRT